MNTPNNKRRKESQRKIEEAFIKLLQEKEVNKVSVTDICKEADVNRTTFYANYIDIINLAESIQRRLEEEVIDLFKKEQENNENKELLKIFIHMKNNQLFYKAYFKLGLKYDIKISEYDIYCAEVYYNSEYIEYHFEFFRNGLNAVMKKWLENGCRESPEEMYKIIRSEYIRK